MRAKVRKATAVSARWLHVYLSMVSFGVVLFFAATGLTLNHPDWFAKQSRTIESHGAMSSDLLNSKDASGADKLGVVEKLRAADHVQGAVSDFRVDDSQVSVSFKAPGYTADAFIDRATGKYDLTVVKSGFVAVMNDLHKGRDAGKVWAGVIDASAILLVLVSLTGLVLIWFVYKRRVSGLILAGVGTLIIWWMAKAFVP